MFFLQYAKTKEAERRSNVAEQKNVTMELNNQNLRKLYQATHALAGAFPENSNLQTVLQDRIVGPVHSGVLSPLNGLKELDIVCTEHDESMLMLRDGGKYIMYMYENLKEQEWR